MTLAVKSRGLEQAPFLLDETSGWSWQWSQNYVSGI
jgi:hypothetical protein